MANKPCRTDGRQNRQQQAGKVRELGGHGPAAAQSCPTVTGALSPPLLPAQLFLLGWEQLLQTIPKTSGSKAATHPGSEQGRTGRPQHGLTQRTLYFSLKQQQKSQIMLFSKQCSF